MALVGKNAAHVPQIRAVRVEALITAMLQLRDASLRSAAGKSLHRNDYAAAHTRKDRAEEACTAAEIREAKRLFPRRG